MKKIITQLLLSVQNIEKMMQGSECSCSGKGTKVCRLESAVTVPQSGEQLIRYADDELMTVKEAEGELGVSRWKIYQMRCSGELTSIERNGWVRLVRVEVEAARLWYSIPKGKV